MRSPFSTENITLYILAGGKSSRFGEDKARYKWKGRMLIEHVHSAFRELGEVKAVVKKGNSFSELDIDCVYDEHGDGPLSGIHAALVDAKTEWVFIVPCDTLDFSTDWLQSFSGHTEKAIAFHDEKWFPLFSAFHKDALPQIKGHLEARKFSIWQALDSLDAAKIQTPKRWHTLHRIDSKEDLEKT